MNHMTLGISVRFLGPTNTRGARVVARCNGRRIVRGWDHALTAAANYDAAAEAMLARLQSEKYGWYWQRAKLLQVQSDEIRGYVFALVTPD